MAGLDVLNGLPLPGKIAVGAGLLGLVGITYATVFYSELSDQLSAAETRQEQLGKSLSEARKAEYAFQKDVAELTERQQKERELNRALPTSSEYPAFLSSVQNVANVSGVGLTAWAPQAEVVDKFYARVPMRVEVTGRFHQVAKFFYSIGQLDRVINMENISLTDPKVNGEDVVLKVDGLATAFRALNPSEQKPDKRGKK